MTRPAWQPGGGHISAVVTGVLLAVVAPGAYAQITPTLDEFKDVAACGPLRGTPPAPIDKECTTWEGKDYVVFSLRQWPPRRGRPPYKCYNSRWVKAADVQASKPLKAMCKASPTPPARGIVQTRRMSGETHRGGGDRDNRVALPVTLPGYIYCSHRIRELSVNPPNESNWRLTLEHGHTADGKWFENMLVDFHLEGPGNFNGRAWVRFHIDVYQIRVDGDLDPTKAPEFNGALRRCNDREIDFKRTVGPRPRPLPPSPPPAPAPTPPSIQWPPADYGEKPGAPMVSFSLCSTFATRSIPIVVADRKAKNAIRYSGSVEPKSCVLVYASTGESGEFAAVWVYRRDVNRFEGFQYLKQGERKEPW